MRQDVTWLQTPVKYKKIRFATVWQVSACLWHQARNSSALFYSVSDKNETTFDIPKNWNPLWIRKANSLSHAHLPQDWNRIFTEPGTAWARLVLSLKLSKSSSSSRGSPSLTPHWSPPPAHIPRAGLLPEDRNCADQFTPACQDSSHRLLSGRCKTHQSCLEKEKKEQENIFKTLKKPLNLTKNYLWSK